MLLWTWLVMVNNDRVAYFWSLQPLEDPEATLTRLDRIP